MNKKALAVAVAGALAVPTAAQAINYKISGQVNRAVMFADDGNQSEVFHVDNDNSSTRFRFTGEEDIGNGMKAGIVWELEYESNAAGRVGMDNAKGTPGSAVDVNNNFFRERKVELYFKGKWGKLTLGQGDGAGNGTTERDTSGTTVARYASRQAIGASLAYTTSAGGTILTDPTDPKSAITIGGAFSNLDATSRSDRIRYDTPTLGPGIVLSASAHQDSLWEVAGSIRTSFAGGKLDAGVHYSDSEERGGFENWGGSISFKFSQGTSITGNYAERDFVGGADADTFGVKLGHSWGNHNVYIDYGETGDLAGAGIDSDTIGVGWVYTMPKPKIDLYAAYSNWDLDVANAEDIDIFMVGSRIKF